MFNHSTLISLVVFISVSFFGGWLFRVEVLFNERKHFVLRRSSEFQALHRKLRKVIQTPDFPSKRNPHLRTKPPEQRRQELEDYVQDIIYQNEDVPQVLLDFLHVRHFHTGNKVSMENSQGTNQSHCLFLFVLSYQLTHQQVFGFFKDPYISDCTSDLPDVIVDGVLQGFYPRDIRVTFTSPTPLPRGRPPKITISKSNSMNIQADPIIVLLF
uniref:Sorting nexin 22 n=1 Tax=Labrus bergylta TaxID=56723 RepID=A0A3Q3M3W4_9LABR